MPDATSAIAGASPYGAIVQGALGAAQAVTGLINAGKAKREAALLAKTRPQYQISPYAGKDVALAESELGNNGSAGQTAYNEGLDRDLATSLDAVLKGGGTPNNISDVFDRSAEGRQRYSIMQDNLKLARINNLVKAHDYYNDQLDKQYQLNQFAPWADKAQANAQARINSQQQIWGGLGTAGSAVAGYFGDKNNADNLNRYFHYMNPPQQQPYVGTMPATIRTTSPIPDMSNNAPTYINPNSMSQLPPLNIGGNSFISPETFGE